MALTEIQKRNALILHSQGDTAEQVAANLHVDVRAVKRVLPKKKDDEQEQGQSEDDEQEQEQQES